MKLFSAEQIRHCDKQTISEQKITSSELMERAAVACLQWIENRYDRARKFLVICGMGNNGGDGLALTRLLIKHGYSASALVVKYWEHFSEDASLNLQRLENLASSRISYITESDQISGISEETVLIDAVFGIGINRPVGGWIAEFFGIINGLPNEKIAIDMPSGLPSDTLPIAESAVLKSDTTLTFQFLKRSFLHQEGARLTGTVHVLDIGLSETFIRDNPSQYQITDKAIIKSIFRPRPPFSHKGSFGNAVLIGGSYGMLGAISLSTMAALRVGTGKVWVQAPECGYNVLQTLCPEALFQKSGVDFIEKIAENREATFGLGPGLGQAPLTKRAFGRFLQGIKTPVVLDADALNIIADSREDLLNQIPVGSVLTPHPGEFKRLFGASENSMEQVEKGRNQAMKLNLIIVLKGRYTAVMLPDGSCFYNRSGNPGLAKGGSGDVLTGIITGLVAQGYEPSHAAILGTWLHGKAADFAAEVKSMEAMTAQDVCAYLGAAFSTLYKR